MGWQPIETNKKQDGKRILGWVEGMTVTMYWSARAESWMLSLGEVDGWAECYPTYWRPELEPPKQDRE